MKTTYNGSCHCGAVRFEADIDLAQGTGKCNCSFCKHCGVRSFETGHVKEIGGDYVSIKVACLDGVDPAELVAGPVTYANGRDNKWWESPAETRHL